MITLILLIAALQAPETLHQEISRLNRSMMEAWQRNDPLAIAAHYADDARIISPSGSTVEGRANINKYWQGFPTQGRTWTLDVFEVGGTRNLAYQYGRSTIAGGTRGQTIDWIGVWKRLPNGELKLAIDYWTSAAADPNAEVQIVRALDAGWAHAYQVHDTAFAISLFADDIIVTSMQGALKTKEQELGDIRPQAGLAMDYFRTRDVLVRQHGATVIVNGIAEWSFTWNGSKSTNTRRYPATYARGGALGWKMVALQLGRAP